MRSFKKALALQIIVVCLSGFAFASGIDVFFNSPPYSNGLDEALIKHIDSAEKTVFAHFYQINRKNIVDAFIRAVKRLGPKNVGLVTDNQYYDKGSYREFYGAMEEAGLKIITDAIKSKGTAQSHNKFCVVDSRRVWTGSYNITDNGTVQNDNDAVLIRSEEVARAYETEFFEMYREHKFGKKKSDNIQHSFTVESAIPVEVYMAPTDNVSREILKEIQDADHSIYFVMFTFTHSDIIRAIEKKISSGVLVKGFIDNLQSGKSYSINNNISGESLEVKWDNSQAMVHHKFMVIDPITDSNPTVITGSFNFTASADNRNDENIVIIHDKKIANQYFKQFIKLFHGKNALPPCAGTVLKLNSASSSEISIQVKDDGYQGEGVDLSELVIGDPFPVFAFPERFSMKTGQTLIISSKLNLEKAGNIKFFSIPVGKTGKILTENLTLWIPEPGVIEKP